MLPNEAGSLGSSQKLVRSQGTSTSKVFFSPLPDTENAQELIVKCPESWNLQGAVSYSRALLVTVTPSSHPKANKNRLTPTVFAPLIATDSPLPANDFFFCSLAACTALSFTKVVVGQHVRLFLRPSAARFTLRFEPGLALAQSPSSCFWQTSNNPDNAEPSFTEVEA